MSQHFFNTTMNSGDPVQVLAGWDRPLQYFFLVIEAECDDCKAADSEGIVYSNIFDQKAPSLDWGYFDSILTERGITSPDGLAEALQEDRLSNAGNSVREWC